MSNAEVSHGLGNEYEGAIGEGGTGFLIVGLSIGLYFASHSLLAEPFALSLARRRV